MLRVLLLGCLVIHATVGQGRVWQDSIQLPTYAEGDPDPVPPFSAFTNGEPGNYPYPYRSQISTAERDRSIVAWRTLNLENEYLSCRILPDLGGHIYNCRDKLSDREVFHTAQVIKKALIGQRGAWISTGVEPNFPVTHSRVSASPLSSAERIDADGSAVVIVSDTDRLTGMCWRVEYRLRPGIAVLEQRVTLYNPTPVRKPYLWWNNAAIERDDPGLRYVFPANLVVSHGGQTIETWPVGSNNVDMSIVENDRAETTWFAYQSREPFMGIYKPKFRSGVAHFADPEAVSGKKLWIMGLDELDFYRNRLTDGGNLYVELQAGSFQDQETYQFLGPEQSRTFSEYWIPFRDMSGLTRATPDVVLYASRAGATLSIELGATRMIAGAKIRVLAGDKPALGTIADLDPRKSWNGSASVEPSVPYAIQVLDAGGKVLLEHREGGYNASKPEGIKIGPQKLIDWNSNVTESLLLKRGDYNERLSQVPFAQSDYAIGSKQFPKNRQFDKAAGRLALSLGKFEEAAVLLNRAMAVPYLDYETLYYAGVAESLNGHPTQAQKLLSQVSPASEFGPASSLQVAFLASRSGDYARALKLIQPLEADPGSLPRIAAIRIALLRRIGNKDAALAEFRRALKFAPEDPLLRYLGTLDGIDDPDLWSYLAGDAERVLNLADAFMELALWEEAETLLARDYAHYDPHFLEPGAVPPGRSALVAYYLAFCRMTLKRDAAAELAHASALGTRYQFPYRQSSYAVLRAALQQNPSDASAHALLGNLDLYSLRIEEASAEWRKAVALNSALEIERNDLARTVSLTIATAGHSPAPLANPAPAAPLSSPPPIAVPPRANGAPSRSPSELAADAMIRAASGAAQSAREIFRAPAFDADKQPLIVRQAYIEVRLQNLLALSASGKCEAIDDRVGTIGLEDRDIAFTLYGFGQFIRTPHFQYYLGVVEANCGLHKQAQKYWTNVAKAKASPSSPEFAYPLLASTRLQADPSKTPAAGAAKSLPFPAQEDATGDSVRALNQALALRAAGDESGTLALLAKIVNGTTDIMVRYLAVTEMKLKFP